MAASTLHARTNKLLTDIERRLDTLVEHAPATFDHYILQAPAQVPAWFVPALEHLERPVKPDPGDVPIKFHNARLAWERSVEEYGPGESGTLSDACRKMGLLEEDRYNDALVTYEGLFCEWLGLEDRYQQLKAEETAFQWPIFWAVGVLNRRNQFLNNNRRTKS